MNFSNNRLPRKLMHAKDSCPFNCQYCFAKWNDNFNYENEDNSSFSNSTYVIYPFCDSEITSPSSKQLLSEIAHLSLNDQKQIIISISTKSSLSNVWLKDLETINKKLQENHGFVKLSVSITNKYSSQIEPGTANYSERIDLLKRLQEFNLKPSLTLKPILPFIHSSEYIEIINDAKEYIDKFLLGGLYVNSSTKFYKEYIEGKFPTQKRCVAWINNTTWEYIPSTNTQQKLMDYIISIGKEYYESDRSLIQSWL